MIDYNVYKYIHKNNSKYRICPVSIRKYLCVEFILDDIQNIINYNEYDFFYLNDNQIVTNYRINLPNKDFIDIPIINSKDVCKKILLHREFMIKHKFKKKIWEKQKNKKLNTILNIFLPFEIIPRIIN